MSTEIQPPSITAAQKRAHDKRSALHLKYLSNASSLPTEH
jgi:hypothetical protein